MMNVGCYLPPSYEEFCAVLGVKIITTQYRATYEGLQLAERRNDWVLDKVKALVSDITRAEDAHELAVTSSNPSIAQILDQVTTAKMLVARVWYLAVFNKYRISNDFHVRTDWNDLCKSFSAFKNARKKGKPFDSFKGKLLNHVKTLAKKYRPECEYEIHKPHRIKLKKRLEITRDLFPLNIVDIHIRASVRSKSDEMKGMKKLVKIGWSMQSTYKPKKVNRDSVVLDDKTTPTKANDKHIVYVPGWSLKPEEI